jgi:two-component system, OmpR family, response regulator ChvI
VGTQIVLVDDDDLWREVMTADLEEHGYDVVGFADGASLLAAVEAGLVAELALVDWSLPQMSGLDLLLALRARGSALPVAFLTARSRAEREADALRAGALDFIDKTCGTDELVQRLGRLLARTGR